MSELQLIKIGLDNIGLLEKFEQYSKKIKKPLPVVIVDERDEIHCGELEKAVAVESGKNVRDLFVRVHNNPGYKIDDEIKELYVIGVDILGYI